MDEQEVLLKDGALKEGETREIEVAGRKILIARVGGAYYAVSGVCPHGGESLVQGKLEGTVIACPRDGSRFDLTDGHVVRWDNWTGLKGALGKPFVFTRSLTPYKVRIQ